MAQTTQAPDQEQRGMAVSVDAAQPRSFAEIFEGGGTGARGPRLCVRFLRRWQVYFADDCATFPQRMAERLVREGYAEPVNVYVGDGPVPQGARMATRYPVPIEERRRRGE